MIEILALAALIACSGLLVFGVYKFIKHREAKQQAEFDAWMKDTDERARVLRETERQRQESIKTAQSYSKPKSYHKSTVTKNSSMSTRTSTASEPANTWSNDLLTTMIIADTISDAVSAFGDSLSSSSGSADSGSSSSSSYSSSPSYSDSSSSSSSYSDSSSSSSSYD